MDGLEKLTKDDRFELLSAYMDNELTTSERRQVEVWLESDAEMRQQYQSLSSLSRSFQAMPMPQSSTSADEMLGAVFAKVDRKPKLLKVAGISAAVVAAIGAVGAFLTPTFSPQLAKQNSPEQPQQPSTPINTALSSPESQPDDFQSIDTDSLMLVLEAPPVDIPVVAESASFQDSPSDF